MCNGGKIPCEGSLTRQAPSRRFSLAQEFQNSLSWRRCWPTSSSPSRPRTGPKRRVMLTDFVQETTFPDRSCTMIGARGAVRVITPSEETRQAAAGGGLHPRQSVTGSLRARPRSPHEAARSARAALAERDGRLGGIGKLWRRYQSFIYR